MIKVTAVKGPWVSLGIHVDLQRFFVELHVIWWIITLGRDYAAAPDEVGCEDCGKPYSEFPIDTVFPNDEWGIISGRESGAGLLCASCVAGRVNELEGAVSIEASIRWQPMGIDLSKAIVIDDPEANIITREDFGL